MLLLMVSFMVSVLMCVCVCFHTLSRDCMVGMELSDQPASADTADALLGSDTD